MKPNYAFDTLIVGGGLVGAAIACGIAATGSRVAVLDGGDRDFRASRGNFGLIWVQGKGADFPAYARLSGIAARQWADFSDELRDATGIDVGLQQTGGYDFCLTPEEWEAREWEMRQVAAHTEGEFEYQMLDQAELRKRIPEVSGDVLGASYSSQDGHVNPLYLLRALHQRMHRSGRGLSCLPRRFSRVVDRMVNLLSLHGRGFSRCSALCFAPVCPINDCAAISICTYRCSHCEASC